MPPGKYDIVVANGLLTINRIDYEEKLKYSFEDGLLVLQTADENVMDLPIIKLKKVQYNP